MEKFDKPIWNEVLLNLDIKELLENCRINKRTSIVCQREDFWLEYLKRKYGLTVLRQDLDAKATAIIADKVLRMLWKKELYPTIKSFNYIIERVEDFDELLQYRTRQQLLTLVSFDDWKGDRYEETEKYFRTQLPQIQPGDMRHLGVHWDRFGLTNFTLNPLAKQNLKSALDFIYVDTNYLTPGGIITLPLNIDRLQYLIMTLQDEDFINLIDGIVRIGSKELIVRYI